VGERWVVLYHVLILASHLWSLSGAPTDIDRFKITKSKIWSALAQLLERPKRRQVGALQGRTPKSLHLPDEQERAAVI
jgi:hypothetical protein